MIERVRMKKGLCRIVLLCVLICLILPAGVGRAEDNFVYGMINGSTISIDDWGNEGVMLRINKNDGKTAVYTCGENMMVNGISYDDVYDMQEAIKIGEDIKYDLQDGQITALTFGREIIDSVTCGRSGNKISVKVEFIKLAVEGKICLAIFSENGLLEKVEYVSAVPGKDEYIIDSEAGENCRIKVFLFDELTVFKPLAEAAFAEI